MLYAIIDTVDKTYYTPSQSWVKNPDKAKLWSMKDWALHCMGPAGKAGWAASYSRQRPGAFGMMHAKQLKIVKFKLIPA